MTMNLSMVLLTITALSFYALTVILSAINWKLPNIRSSSTGTTLSPTWIALVLHALLIQQMVTGNGAINLGFASSLTLFTWCITLISVIVSLQTKLVFLTVIMSVLSSLSIIAALLLPTRAVEEPLTIYLATHIILSMLAYSLLSLSALISILLGIQDYQLNHHQQSQLLRLLPPLQTLENLMFRIIGIGFLLLSFAVVSGFLFAEDWFNHKIVFSGIAWLVFLTLLLGRHFAGWRGQKAIRWTLAGVVSLMLAFFGTKLVFEFILTG